MSLRRAGSHWLAICAVVMTGCEEPPFSYTLQVTSGLGYSPLDSVTYDDDIQDANITLDFDSYSAAQGVTINYVVTRGSSEHRGVVVIGDECITGLADIGDIMSERRVFALDNDFRFDPRTSYFVCTGENGTLGTDND